DRTASLKHARLSRRTQVKDPFTVRRIEAPHATARRVVPRGRLELRLVADDQGPVQLRGYVQVVGASVGALEVQPAADREADERLIAGQLAGRRHVRLAEIADVRVAEQLGAVLDRLGRVTRFADEGVPERLMNTLAVSLEAGHRSCP